MDIDNEMNKGIDLAEGDFISFLTQETGMNWMHWRILINFMRG